MKYYVMSKFYDSGKVVVKIINEQDAASFDKTNKTTKNYDEYWDLFDNKKSAEEFIKEYK